MPIVFLELLGCAHQCSAPRPKSPPAADTTPGSDRKLGMRLAAVSTQLLECMQQCSALKPECHRAGDTTLALGSMLC